MIQCSRRRGISLDSLGWRCGSGAYCSCDDAAGGGLLVVGCWLLVVVAAAFEQPAPNIDENTSPQVL